MQITFFLTCELLSPFSSLVMQTPIFLTKLSDESIIFIIDVGKNLLASPSVIKFYYI
jgi:hypothetical protein